MTNEINCYLLLVKNISFFEFFFNPVVPQSKIFQTNLLTRGELGRHSLQEPILIRNINYIKYVEAKDPQSLVKQAANYEMLHTEERNSL